MTTGIKLPVASATQEGMVSTGSQTFAGAKTLTGLTTVGVAATANNHKVYGNLQLTASESVGGTNAIQIFAADNTARFSIDSSGSATWYAAGTVVAGNFAPSTAVWTLGAGTSNTASSTSTHVVYGRAIQLAADGGTNNNFSLNYYTGGTLRAQVGTSSLANHFIPSTPANTFYLTTNGISFSADSGTTNHGTLSPAGAWLLGPTSGGATSQIRTPDALTLSSGTTAGAQTVLYVSKSHADIASAIYASFHYSGTQSAAGTEAGGIRKNAANSAFEFYGSSDERLKENITPITNGLEKIVGLNPVTFTWKDITKGTTPGRGFIAQQVKQVVPEAVSINGPEESNYYNMGTSEFIPLLIAAVKDLKQQLDSATARITALGG